MLYELSWFRCLVYLFPFSRWNFAPLVSCAVLHFLSLSPICLCDCPDKFHLSLIIFLCISSMWVVSSSVFALCVTSVCCLFPVCYQLVFSSVYVFSISLVVGFASAFFPLVIVSCQFFLISLFITLTFLSCLEYAFGSSLQQPYKHERK